MVACSSLWPVGNWLFWWVRCSTPMPPDTIPGKILQLQLIWIQSLYYTSREFGIFFKLTRYKHPTCARFSNATRLEKSFHGHILITSFKANETLFLLQTRCREPRRLEVIIFHAPTSFLFWVNQNAQLQQLFFHLFATELLWNDRLYEDLLLKVTRKRY